MKHCSGRLIVLTGLFLAATLTGCASTQSGSAERVAVINHVVFFKLKDPAQAEALIADCDANLATISSVTRYYCGTHIDTGRDTIISDYDVGAFVGFDSTDEYAAYVEHPNHIALVDKWRPQLEWLKVYDVHDPTP